jgi:serine/threonine protein kinase
VALTPGTCLGAYEIVALIGSGGMGEVYRARDSRLNRDVAIKVLAADVAELSPRTFCTFPREFPSFRLQAAFVGQRPISATVLPDCSRDDGPRSSPCLQTHGAVGSLGWSNRVSTQWSRGRVD